MVEKNKSENTQKAVERSSVLKARIQNYLEARPSIPTGRERASQIQAQKEKILEIIGGTEEDWKDWQWQLKNRISDSETLGKALNLSQQARDKIDEIGKKYRWSISPYYLSLIDPDNRMDPVKLQSVPSSMELISKGIPDPMGEEYTSPVPSITRRYPDRLIIKVTNQCGMYCRHCQRRRAIGEVDRPTPQEQLEEAINYVKGNPEIRDVLLTGGDAFMLSNERIEWLLSKLREIEHLEIIRLGSRTLVTLPQRVDDELVEILSRHHPVFVNTQFNHPQEISEETAEACAKLSNAGVPLGNQMVLLRNVNDDPNVVKKMNHELLRIRVSPYYIFHAKGVEGTTHFRTRVEKGMEIMEKLRGQTSGLAIPTFIINAPLGYGKTPVLPDYIVSWADDHLLLRTWEGRVMEYPNKLDEWKEDEIF